LTKWHTLGMNKTSYRTLKKFLSSFVNRRPVPYLIFEIKIIYLFVFQYLVSLLCEEKVSQAEKGSGKFLAPTSAMISQPPIKLLTKENSQVGLFDSINIRGMLFKPLPSHNG